jgi:protein-disulfide isomerase
MLLRMPIAALLSAVLLFPLTGLAAGSQGGHILGGPTNAPIRIEVFSDFECPGCRALYLDTIRKVIQEYSTKGKVCVVYHEFPLRMHKYSREAAKYAGAAAKIGPSTLMKVMDALFMYKDYWESDGKIEQEILKSKALSPEEFTKVKEIMKTSAASIDTEIEKDILLGQQMGVTETPTFFTYYKGKQKKMVGVVIYLVMKEFLDEVIK